MEFLNHRNFLIEKYAKIPKYIIPKQFHLVLHPRFDEAKSNTTNDLEPFTYSGYIYVTVVSKKNSNKRIELNAKNLKVMPDDVSVYRSLTWSSIDFDDDPDWNSREIKYIVVQRNKRDLSQMESNSTETMDDDGNNGGEVMDSGEQPEASEFTFINETLQTRNKTYFYPKFVSCGEFSLSKLQVKIELLRILRTSPPSVSLTSKQTKLMTKLLFISQRRWRKMFIMLSKRSFMEI